MSQEQISVQHYNGVYRIAIGVPDQTHLQSFDVRDFLVDGHEYDSYDDAMAIALEIAQQTGRSVVGPNGTVIV